MYDLGSELFDILNPEGVGDYENKIVRSDSIINVIKFMRDSMKISRGALEGTSGWLKGEHGSRMAQPNDLANFPGNSRILHTGNGLTGYKNTGILDLTNVYDNITYQKQYTGDK